MKPRHLARLPAARSRGMSLLELMFAVAVIGILSAIAVPSYERYRERALVSRAAQDIGDMSVAIERYTTRTMRLPVSLAEAGLDARRDPWGRAYVFLNFAEETKQGRALKPRRDGKLRPINSDYDLYSIGKDGQSKEKLTDRESLDDVVRALDGSFIGAAKDF